MYYPGGLVDEAMRGRFYAFGTACECGTAYLIQTEPDGAHCKVANTVEAISELYEGHAGGRKAPAGDPGSTAVGQEEQV